ncbi:hypothetical protein BV898_11462 [Hypsibius exemplaris]|uniref:Single domain-containing protein n=1 Tax=Hypsibius exemplaris TaxID=2072580 RepID=A0A1W0WGL4_HYPEX|nr:hypothetical protein BV898_11462 [Hypsibius exemplaris]
MHTLTLFTAALMGAAMLSLGTAATLEGWNPWGTPNGGCPSFPQAVSVTIAGRQHWFVGDEEVSGRCITPGTCLCANIVDPCFGNPRCLNFPDAVCMSNCCQRHFYRGTQEVSARCITSL